MVKINPRVLLLLSGALIIFILLNYRWLELSLLQLYSKDDFGFYRVLRKMYLALTLGDVKTLFQYNYYNYGFSYFFLNELICFPFFMTENTRMVIFLPRMVSALSALISAFYFYKIARLFLDEKRSILLLLFSMSLPAFWKLGMFFHPDWTMGCFLTISTYFLARDQHQFGKDYRKALVFLGMAVGIKFQALIFLPLLFCIIFYHEISSLDFSGFRKSLLRGFKALFVIAGIFLLNNPYIIHPKGFEAFTNALQRNMASNSTNHFSYVDLSLTDKLQMLDGNYMNYIFLGLLFLANVFFIFKVIIRKEKSFFLASSICSIIVLLYLLLFVNKAWTHYYLTVMLLSLLVVIPILQLLKPATGFYLLLLLCGVQVSYYPSKYRDFFSMKKDIEDYDIDIEQARINFAFIQEHAETAITPRSHILITPALPFDHKQMGIPFENVHLLNGHLKEKWLVKETFLAENPRSAPDEFIYYDLLILRKDYIRKLAEGSTADAENRHAQLLMQRLKRSEFGYELLAENEWVLMFKRQNNPKP